MLTPVKYFFEENYSCYDVSIDCKQLRDQKTPSEVTLQYVILTSK